MRTLLRRWAPLVFLLPLSYLLTPLFWAPLDQRFYNYFVSKRPDPMWTHVAVVEIDDEARRELLTAPIYPLSRHAGVYARLVTALARAGASAIVLDMQMDEDTFDAEPDTLADAMREAGNVVLVMSLAATSGGGHAEVIQAAAPHPLLASAARGVFVTDVRMDNDGVLRRVAPNAAARRLGLTTLPEELTGVHLDGPVPIEFPSPASPIPSVSAVAVLGGSRAALETTGGRIVFVGSTLNPSSDYVVAPRPQRVGAADAFLLSGVDALAAITETLAAGAPVRDAHWPVVLAWNALWAAIAVVLVRRRRPVLSVALLGAAACAALLVTGLLQARVGLVFPAGLLLGCVVVGGGYTLVYTYVQTTRELYLVLKRSHDELEEKVRQRTADLASTNSELSQALETVKATQVQLIQAEKMASLGKLVAGIAHEINNPIGAVNSALDVSRRCIEKIESAVQGTDADVDLMRPLSIMKQNNDSAETAGERIADIVRNLKNFARLDEADFQEVDVHDGIDSTLALLDHEIRPGIGIERRYGELPRLRCYVRELNQALMHVLRNAIQSIDGEGIVTVTTSSRDGDIVIEIADTGAGIPAEALPRVFDPGFTTRGVGVGTGLGLSIAYTVVEKHGGSIGVESEGGEGTVVRMTLPPG